MPAAYLAPPRPISLHAVLDASSSAGTVPTIDLEWEPFHAHVEAFLNAIDQYTMDAKTEIARRASEHVDMVRDMKAEKEEVERRITLEREREAVMLATLEQERHTVGDLSSSLARLQQTLSKTKEQSAAVEAELNAVRKEVKAERGEKERQGKVLEQQRGRDAIELQILQEVLGLRIEGVKADELLMRFTLLDPSDPEREFSMIIDVSKHEYTVPNCSPPLSALPELLRQLNADRDLYSFIKRVRKAFRALVPNPPAAPSKFDDLSGPGLRAPVAENSGDAKDVEDGSAMQTLRIEA
ncbi:Probable kinetochore protein SPC25 [Saitozyma sp. JCM 24511]|nr:Probable kinetochore protein SPC25 [Saitozyma sp. JCM 24511]